MKINEKINWYNFLLAFGISYATVSNYQDYSVLKRLYNVINSPSSIPSNKDSVIINNIKIDVLNNIRNSNLFNKFGKQFVIDSIENMSFKIVDTIDFITPSVACYINIKDSKKYIKSYFLDKPSGDNFIIIQRSSMNKPNISSTITHEIYHYLDKLIGDENVSYSEEAELNKFADIKVNNKEYAIKKLSALLFGKFPDNKDSDLMNVLEDVYRDIKNDKKYYTSSSEIFARYEALKYDMIKAKIIFDINDEITIEKLSKFIIQCSTEEKIDNYKFIFYLDLSKLHELDQLL